MIIICIIYNIYRIELGTFPSQRIIPYISYFLSYQSENVIILISSQLNGTSEEILLNETIENMGGYIMDYIMINDENENEIEQAKTEIRDFISSYKLSIPDNGIIINYLKNEELFIEVYKSFKKIILNDYSSLKEASEDYVVISFDTRYFSNLDSELRDYQFVEASCYINNEIDSKVQNAGNSIFNENYLISNTIAKGVIAYEILMEIYISIQNFTKERVYNYINENEFSTSYGTIKTSSRDTTIPFPITILVSKDNVIELEFEVSKNWPAEAYRHNFNIEEYTVCNKIENKEIYRNSIKFLFLIPFTGSNGYLGNSLINAYLSAIDYVNIKGGINGMVAVPKIINTESDVNIVIDNIHNVINETHSRIIFGTGTAVRTKILDDLEKEEILLFYPYQYEGYECKENIIYMGSPFSELLSVISYIYRSLSTNIFVLYSDTTRNNKEIEIVSRELESRGITIIRSLKIPIEQFQMDIILNIIENEMSQGVILSFLESDASTELFVELHNNKITSTTYQVVSFNVDLTQIVDNKLWEYFDGHYFVNGFTEDIFEDKTIFETIRNKYTFIKEGPSIPAILSVLAAAEALKKVNVTYTTEGITYNFEDLLTAIHEVEFTDPKGLKINENNQFSLYMNISKIIYNSEDKSHSIEPIIHIEKNDYINPYLSQYETENVVYYCNWGVLSSKRGDKLEYNTTIVALLYEITGSNSVEGLKSLDIMIACIDDLNKEGILNDTYLYYKIVDTNNVNYGEIGKELANDDTIELIIGCENSDCRKTVSTELKKTGKALWYPKDSEGQECEENIFYTGLIPSIYIKQFSSFIDQTVVNTNIWIVGSKTEEQITIHNILIGLFESLYPRIGTEYEYIEQGKGTSYTAIDNVIASNNNGIIVISTLDSETAVDFINYYNTLVYEKDKHMIISLLMTPDVIPQLSLSGYVYVYITGSYFDEINPECEFLQTVYNHYGKIDANYISHSSYLSLRLWAKAVVEYRKTGGNDTFPTLKELQNQIYTETFEGCVGNVMMFSSNHISLPFFIMEINSDNTLSLSYQQIRIQEPLPWSWQLEEFNGQVCDFSNPNVGEIGGTETIKVIVALSISGDYRENDMYVLNIFEILVADLNNNQNGLLRIRIVLESYDISSNDETCYECLNQYLMAVDKGVIFTTASSVCLGQISELLNEKDIALFEIGYTGGETCDKNIFYTLKEPSFVDRVVDYIMEPTQPETLNFCVLTTNDEIGVAYYNYIIAYLGFAGASTLYSNQFSLSSTSLTDIIRAMKNKAPNGCYILFVGTPNIHLILDNSMKEMSLNRDIYPLVSLTTASNALSKGVNVFYSAQSYFTNLDTEMNVEFQNIGLDLSEYASEIMFSGYIAFNIFLNSVNQCGNTHASNLRTVIYNIEYNSPSGIIKMNTNNYIKQYIIYGKSKINDPKYGYDVIFKSETTHTPVAWKNLVSNGVYMCRFDDESIGDKYKESTVTIGIITSYTGEYNTSEISITNGVIQAINEINESGGILGKKITILIRDAKSILSNYIKYGEEFNRLDEIEVVFGGSRPEIAEVLSPLFDQNQKIYFYSGLSLSETCPKYTFHTQLTVNQLINGVWKYILPTTKHVYIIEDNEKFSSQFTKGLKELCEDINIKINIYNYTNILNSEENIDIKNIDDNSAIILSIKEENNKEIFNWLCKNEVNTDKTYVVAITLDRYLMEYIPKECLSGVYILTTFVKEMGISTSDANTYISSSESFVSNMKSRYGENVIITSSMESGYIAVKLWSDVVVAYTMTFDTEKVREALYAYTMMAPSGKVEMNTAGSLNRIVFLCKIDNNKSFKVTEYASDPEQAEAWMHYYKENEGYLCDWTVPSEKYRPNIFKILFFHETTENQEKELNAMIIEYSLVQDINYNGINNHNIVPIFLFAGSTEEFENISLPYLDDPEVVGYFGCQTDMCSKNALNIANRNQKLYVYYGFSEGNSCYPYRLNVGTTSSQRFLAAEKYLSEQGVSSLIFLSEDNELMNSYFNLVYYYVKAHYTENRQTISRLRITKDTVDTIIQEIINRKNNVGRVALLYYLEGDISNSFINAYISNNINSREVLLTFLNFKRTDYTDEILSSIYGSIVVLGFEETLSTAISQSFVSDAKGFIGVNSNVDDNIESIKDAFSVWEEMLTVAAQDSGKDIPPLRYLQLTSIGLEIEVPSGIVKVEESLYVSRNSYVFEINRNAKFIQLFPSRGSNYIFGAEPYPEGLPEECKYGKDNVFYEYSPAIVAISYSLMGISVLCGLSSFIFVIVHSKQSIIRTFGRSFNYMMAISLIFLSLSSLPMSFYPGPSNSVCEMRVVILALATKGLIGVLFSVESKLYMKKRKIRTTIRKVLYLFIYRQKYHYLEF